jgi:hypothetical protein
MQNATRTTPAVQQRQHQAVLWVKRRSRKAGSFLIVGSACNRSGCAVSVQAGRWLGKVLQHQAVSMLAGQVFKYDCSSAGVQAAMTLQWMRRPVP